MKKKTIISIILGLAAVSGLIVIHERITVMNAPTMQELADANPWAVPTDWFKTDTITVKGRIENYDAEQLGFTSMHCYYEDVFENNDMVLTLDIADDGTFCKKFLASYPVRQSFVADSRNFFFDEIPFFARPGETIDITVRQGMFGTYKCVYNNGSSRDVERWLRTSDKFTDILTPLGRFEGTFAEVNEMADKIWKKLMSRLQKVSRSENYTPMEMQLALADVQARFGQSYMSYAIQRQFSLIKQEERNGEIHTEILDSAEWKKLFDYRTYTPLHHIRFDNPLLFASEAFGRLTNRIQHAIPANERRYRNLTDKSDTIKVSFKNDSTELANSLAALHNLTRTGKNNLMAQLCAYKNMILNFNYWRNHEETIPRILSDNTISKAEKKEMLNSLPRLSKMFPLYLNAFTTPYFRQKAEQFHARKMAQTDIATPLPDTPAAKLIRSLVAKYPGRILVIDFWGMNCGPCRLAIQESKDLRAQIAKRNDVKLVFIAGERTAEGSEAYKKYVAEWLAGEETVCVTNSDFIRLQELFQFNGIPHYETITPDCRRVRDDLRIYGFYNFDYELGRLKEKLK